MSQQGLVKSCPCPTNSGCLNDIKLFLKNWETSTSVFIISRNYYLRRYRYLLSDGADPPRMTQLLCYLGIHHKALFKIKNEVTHKCKTNHYTHKVHHHQYNSMV